MNNYTPNAMNYQMFYVSNKNINDLNGDRKKLQASLGYALRPLNELKEALQNGHKVSFAIHSDLSERKSLLGQHWQEQFLFPVDFDNSPISLEETLKLLAPLGKPMFYYKTFSKNSFRIVYHVTERYRDYLLQTTIGTSEIAREERWKRAETFWQALFVTIGDLTGLSVGASKKEKRDEKGNIIRQANEFVVDTQVIRQHLATNGTIHEVTYNPDGFMTREASALVINNIKQPETKKKQKIETIKRVGEKWNYQQVEKRCQQLGVISDTRAWLGAFNSLILGLEHEFSDVTPDEAIQIFMANCDDGNGKESQYQQMIKRHKPHLANIELFWGKQEEQVAESNVDFSKVLWFNKNAETLGNKQYINPEKVIENTQKNSKLLVVAPAGAGKTTNTFTAIDFLLEQGNFKRCVFALPTTIAAKQIVKSAKEKGHQVASQYKDFELQAFERGLIKTLVCTFNKLQMEKYDDEDTLIIIDEVHLLNDFNSFNPLVMTYMRKILMNEQRSVICLTATPHALPQTFFSNVIAYKKDFNKNVVVTELPKGRKNQLAEFIQTIDRDHFNNKKTLIYINSRNQGEKIKRDLEMHRPTLKIGLVNSDNKHNSEDYDKIVKKATFISDVVICTKLLNVAVSIEETVGTIVGVNLYDFTEIMQLINRERGECRFLLLYTENALRKLKSTQAALNSYIKLTKTDIARVIEHNSKSIMRAEMSSKLSNKIVNFEEEITEDKATFTLTVDEWLHKYNYHHKEIVKTLDPNDIVSFLKQSGVVVRKNFSDNEDMKETEHEDDAFFDWKNTKQFFKKETKVSVELMHKDREVAKKLDKHLLERVDKRERKRIKFVVQNFELYELLQKHNVTDLIKLNQLLMLKDDFANERCSLAIFRPILNSLWNQSPLEFTQADKTAIGLTIGKRKVSDYDCVTFVRKIVAVNKVRETINGERVYLHFATL